MDPEHPKPKFVKETLLRCLRLSYHQRVADGVPESFQGLVPDMPDPIFKYKLPSDQPADEMMQGTFVFLTALTHDP